MRISVILAAVVALGTLAACSSPTPPAPQYGVLYLAPPPPRQEVVVVGQYPGYYAQPRQEVIVVQQRPRRPW